MATTSAITAMTQVYMLLKSAAWEETASTIQIQNCVSVTSDWMSCNMLKVKEEKMNLLCLHLNTRPDAYVKPLKQLGQNTMQAASLGIFFDSQLTMARQISAVAESC